MAAPHAQRREVEVVLDREVEEKPRLLVCPREPDPRSGARRRCRHIVAEQFDRTRRDVVIAGDQVEQRRLAGAVRTQDRPALPGDDLEVDVAYRVQAAEAPADPPQAEGRLGASDFDRCFGQRLT